MSRKVQSTGLKEEKSVKDKGLGKVYQDNEVIIEQGSTGDCMFVIQQGAVEVLVEEDGHFKHIAELTKNDFFGEMALFEKEVRSATVRSKGESRVLTIDKKNFMRRIHEDPSLAFRICQSLSNRIRVLNKELLRYTGE